MGYFYARTGLEEKFDEHIKNCVEACGYILYACRIFRTQKQLEVLIDHPENKPISIGDCVKVAKAIKYQLPDAELAIEVSSPGIDRPLLSAEHYLKVIGQIITVKTKSGERITGTLLKASSESITIRAENSKEHLVEMNAVSTGKLISHVGEQS